MIVWVPGSGGLLGSAIRRRLDRHFPGARVFEPPPFPWTDADALPRAIADAAAAFGRETGPWMLLWCAGAGVVGTSAEEMARETATFETFLERLGDATAGRPGALFLAGSAGGLHGGSRETPITEETPPQPSSDYGRAKLRQEELLAAWAARHPAVSTLTGRLSNLYGPAQKLSKPQGLIAHLSRCMVHHVPAHVFAPLDTLRDHLEAGDAADQIFRSMARLLTLPPGTRVTRIVASGQTTSIGGILAIFSRIAKRQPRIVCSGAPVGKLQPSRLSLRSRVWPELVGDPTPLPSGIFAVYQHQLRLFQDGRLPLPPSTR